MIKKRALSLFLLSLIASIFIIQFVVLVSAAPDDLISPFFKDIWDSWKNGDKLPEGVAKVLLVVIIGLLVYSVLDKLPMFANNKNSEIKAIMSGIIGFLGGAYITPEEVYGILLTYSAMGFALAILLPFLILVFFSYDIWANNSIKNTAIKKGLLVILWGGFAIFIFIRILGLYNTTSSTVSQTMLYSHWLILGLSILIVLFNGYIAKIIAKGEIKGLGELTNQRFEEAEIAIDNLSSMTRSTARSNRRNRP